MSNKTLYYIGLAALIIFIMYSSLNSDDIRFSIEWITKFVLPWLFFYWFVKMVRKMK